MIKETEIKHGSPEAEEKSRAISMSSLGEYFKDKDKWMIIAQNSKAGEISTLLHGDDEEWRYVAFSTAFAETLTGLSTLKKAEMLSRMLVSVIEEENAE